MLFFIIMSSLLPILILRFTIARAHGLYTAGLQQVRLLLQLDDLATPFTTPVQLLTV
jgi:hypothetical protein